MAFAPLSLSDFDITVSSSSRDLRCQKKPHTAGGDWFASVDVDIYMFWQFWLLVGIDNIEKS